MFTQTIIWLSMEQKVSCVFGILDGFLFTSVVYLYQRWLWQRFYRIPSSLGTQVEGSPVPFSHSRRVDLAQWIWARRSRISNRHGHFHELYKLQTEFVFFSDVQSSTLKGVRKVGWNVQRRVDFQDTLFKIFKLEMCKARDVQKFPKS